MAVLGADLEEVLLQVESRLADFYKQNDQLDGWPLLQRLAFNPEVGSWSGSLRALVRQVISKIHNVHRIPFVLQWINRSPSTAKRNLMEFGLEMVHNATVVVVETFDGDFDLVADDLGGKANTAHSFEAYLSTRYGTHL